MLRRLPGIGKQTGTLYKSDSNWLQPDFEPLRVIAEAAFKQGETAERERVLSMLEVLWALSNAKTSHGKARRMILRRIYQELGVTK